MKAIERAFAEIAGLFVDDKWYALAIALWVLVNAGLAATSVLDPHYRALVFAVGLLAILFTSVLKAGSR